MKARDLPVRTLIKSGMPVLESCQQYLGRAKVRLEDIVLQPHKQLSLPREKIQRLVETFK